MQKNDYRRALIMLRSLMNGYSGHARMEIRTLTGNLNIRATVPQSAQSVRAALVGRRASLYFAHPLGNLRRDMRGQAVLSVNFDPRDVGGRTLDTYSLLALVTINDGVCELALVGNLNGSCENDWSRVRDVVCALYAPQPRTLEEPPAAVPYSLERADGVVCEGDSCPVTFGERHNGGGNVEEESIAERDNDRDESADENSDAGLVWDFTVEEEPESEEEEAETGEGEESSGASGEDEAQEEQRGDSDEYEVPEVFRREGWSYARTMLPAGCGYAYAWVGMPDCGGEICCALPGNFDTQPPVGLDDYQWVGDSGAGWWVKCYAAQTWE